MALLGGGGVGSGGTGMVLGTVVGLGSVIVDGQHFSSATPTYYSASGGSGEVTTNSQAVEVGARVALQLGSDQQPTSLLIEPELEGAPTQVDTIAQTLHVQGVRVLVNTDPARGPVTFYSGLSGLSAVAAAPRVEVHGAYGEDASGPYILASLIEQLPSTDTVTRITGVIDAVSPQSLSVAGQTIPLGSSTTVVLPPGAGLAQGELAHAWNSGGNWVVRVEALGSFTGAVQLSGVVYGIGANGFMLSGIPVDARALGSAATALHAGDYVVVSGQGNGQGTLVAQSVQAPATTVVVQGTITGYVDSSSFQLRGVPIDATLAAFTPGSSASQLGNGAYVVIQGAVSSSNPNKIQALQVSVLPSPPDGETVDLQGVVASVSDSSHFTLLWQPDGGSQQQVPVSVAANAQTINASATGLAAQAPVEVEGTLQNGVLTACTIKFLPSGVSGSQPGVTQDVSGRVYGWSPGGSSFLVNGIAMTLAQGVSLPAAFDNGVSVEVSFTPSGAGSGVVQEISLDN